MATLKETLYQKIEGWRPRTTKLIKKHAGAKLMDLTIGQAIGGARGVRCLVTDISYLDPHEGIRFRGLTIPELMDKLPKPEGKDMPYVEGTSGCSSPAKSPPRSRWRTWRPTSRPVSSSPSTSTTCCAPCRVTPTR